MQHASGLGTILAWFSPWGGPDFAYRVILVIYATR